MEDLKLGKAVASLWRLRWKDGPSLQDIPPMTIMWQWAPDYCPLCERELVVSERYQYADGLEMRVLYASCVGTPRAHPFILWPVAD